MNALEMLRERKKQKPVVVPVVEQDPPAFLAEFFAAPVSVKPCLPEMLLPFDLMHRHACTGGLPADKAAEIIEAINDAADRKGLRLSARLEELEELDAWFMAWMLERVDVADPDPFEETD